MKRREKRKDGYGWKAKVTEVKTSGMTRARTHGGSNKVSKFISVAKGAFWNGFTKSLNRCAHPAFQHSQDLSYNDSCQWWWTRHSQNAANWSDGFVLWCFIVTYCAASCCKRLWLTGPEFADVLQCNMKGTSQIPTFTIYFYSRTTLVLLFSSNHLTILKTIWIYLTHNAFLNN